MNVFDFVKNITESQEDVLTEETTRDYAPFVINRALSFNLDCVFVVQELNKYGNGLSKRIQYEYLRNSIDKKKRYGRWTKRDTVSEDIELIKRAYNYSNEKAQTVLSVLTDKQLLELRQIMNTGGKV